MSIYILAPTPTAAAAPRPPRIGRALLLLVFFFVVATPDKSVGIVYILSSVSSGLIRSSPSLGSSIGNSPSGISGSVISPGVGTDQSP